MGCVGEVAAWEVPGDAFFILDLWQGPNLASWARQACDRGSLVSQGTQDYCSGEWWPLAGPEANFLGNHIVPKNSKMNISGSISMTAKKQEQPKRLSAEEQRNGTWPMDTMEYYSARKKNGIPTHAKHKWALKTPREVKEARHKARVLYNPTYIKNPGLANPQREEAVMVASGSRSGKWGVTVN